MQIESALIYPPDLYTAENELAWLIANILKTKLDDIDPIVDGLLHKQPDAVVNACTSKISILTGPPGTGKTTTSKKIVESFEQAGLHGALACPTGKARKRADEVINEGKSIDKKLDCHTIHSLLNYIVFSNSFEFNRTNYLPYDYVVMDEFSMADLLLARDFFEAIDPKRTRVVLCGDPHQLPSVGPGNISRDLIQCGAIPTVELDKVLRTGPNSGITYNASRMLNGRMFSKYNTETGDKFTDCFFIAKTVEDTPKSLTEMICDKIPDKMKFSPIEDIQLLCPGKKGEVGTVEMNNRLKDILNPRKDSGLFGFRKGDKVINTGNNRKLGLTNGDIGIVVDHSAGERRTPQMQVDFSIANGEQGSEDYTITLGYEQIKKIQHAYAYTIHRSQGSEYKCSIEPIHRTHYTLINRPLVYTGFTRAKRLSIIVGDEKMLSTGIKNASPQKRTTRLKESIMREVQKTK